MESKNSPAGLREPLVIDVAPNAGPLDLDSYLSTLDAQSKRAASHFVFRLTPELDSRLMSSEGTTARADLLARVAEGIPIQSMTFQEGEIRLSRIEPNGLVREPIEAIANVRQADLRRLVRQYEDLCYYKSNPKHHYIAPSGQHCSEFFRLGDAIHSRDALDRLAFWLQPYIAHSAAVLIDTWSIASLVLRAQQLQRLDIPFDCLARHPESDRVGALEILERLINDLKPEGRLTCVISVTSSGRYVEIVTDLCNKLQTKNVDFIAIYRLAGVLESVNALCQLDLKPSNQTPGDCTLCKQGSTAITLHPGLYYLKDLPEIPLVLGKTHFPSDPPTFIARYHELPGLMSVHRDDRQQRHHGFHINVGVLLTHPLFQGKLKSELDNLGTKPDVILTSSDEVSVKMGEVAVARLQCPKIAVDSLRNVKHLSDVQRTLLRDAKHFLVLDDVLVSGGRLSMRNAELRERKEGPPASVSLIVGLGRPSSQKEWEKHRSALTKNVPWKASLTAIETFFLPDWDSKKCPWCREYEFLQEIARPLPEPPPWLVSRMSRLMEGERGACDEPLWFLPGLEVPSLGHGSLLGPEGMNAMATLFSFAEGIERLRSDEAKPLNPHYPDFHIFDVKNLVNYSEGLLRAVILRAVLPKEWGHSLQVAKVARELHSAATQPNQAVILGELFLAIGRGSVDRTLASLDSILRTEYQVIYRLLFQSGSRPA